MKPNVPREAKHVASIAMWTCDPPPADVRASIERIARAPGVDRIAVMPDVHLAHGVCVGLAVATRDALYPQAVGGDIGCGMTAVALDAEDDLIADAARRHEALRLIAESVPIMRHRRLASAPPLPGALAASPLSDPALSAAIRRDAAIEYGTLGRGNHFIEVQSDADGRLWLMVHSGSRGVGQAITGWHLARAAPAGGGLAVLDAREAAGRAYLADTAWAVTYAAASRRAMLEAVAGAFARRFASRADAHTWINCDHNHVSVETLEDRTAYVHRKGANAASEGQPGIIGGAMGRETVITAGRGHKAALCSSSHGAGRRLSRTDARRQISVARLHAELGDVVFDVRLASALVEEAPSAYKDLRAVLRAQRELVRVVRRLRSRVVFKGG